MSPSWVLTEKELDGLRAEAEKSHRLSHARFYCFVDCFPP